MRINHCFPMTVTVLAFTFFVCFQSAVAEPREPHQYRYQHAESTQCMDLVEDLQAQIEELEAMLENYGTVPQTGQKLCWQCVDYSCYEVVEIFCEGTGQDGELRKGVVWSPETRFTDNEDGTVTDNLTKLIWLQDAGCLGRNWWEALEVSNSLAAGQCGLNDGSQAGDWRLPNIRELDSLIDFSKTGPALPEDNPFLNVSYQYWSSTSLEGEGSWGPENAWLMYMFYGYRDFYEKRYVRGVWPVRDEN